ncbi:MAG TPA: hypothetical protein PKD09_06620 [Aggregatilinea sp.]|uniref:glycosyltransferase family 2 protein n=1 Tax=Aggregatilinea sp. TaxID=2806333 RepID=UPI002CDF3ED0|nr:hypothetical protein [Aggregatilinea sp.]HML21301.1 hypothetical protein [Aggregatilinea sp.]
MDLSLVTSLFRSEAHLPLYGQRVSAVIPALRRAGLSLELALVANGASAQERRAIETLAAEVGQAGAHVIIQYVERETVYASWNRGIRASSGDCLGFWNVDDLRYAPALIEGIGLLRDGCALVDFPFEQITQRKALGLLPVTQTRIFPALYDSSRVTPRAGVGPFFLFTRALFEQVGPFDDHFRVTGDFEWAMRDAVRAAHTCAGTELGGAFFLHGANLSGSRNPYEWVEHNTVLLRHGEWDQIRPVDPDLMRASWQGWGAQDAELPPEVEARLWGADADAFRRQWRRDRRRANLSRLIRAVPRAIIDRTGLRPLLARWGLVQPADPKH